MATNTEARLAENKKKVKQFWEAFSRSDFETVMDMLDDNVQWWVSGTTGISGTYDKPGLMELFTSVAGGTKSGIKVTPTLMTAEEDRVAMEAKSEGETLEGKRYQNDYHFLHILRDGKLYQVREYMDPEHVREVFNV